MEKKILNFTLIPILIIGSLYCQNASIRDTDIGSPNTNSKISFIFQSASKDEYSFKYVTIKLKKKFPKPSLILSTFLGIPDIAISTLALVDPDIEISLGSITDDSKISFNIEPGEYYMSIDTNKSKRFQFEPFEDYFFVASFGYEYLAQGKFDEFSEVNRKKCDSNENYKINWTVTPKYIACPKVKVSENKEIIIKIKASEKNWSDIPTILFKFFPGLIILGPINNFPDPYFIRKFSIDIETIDTKIQAEENKPQ